METETLPSPVASNPPRGSLSDAAPIATVFVCNAALLVLQLVSGPLLSPFIGSSLETWTTIIAVYLTGIALGNHLGARLAVRADVGAMLRLSLALCVVSTLWLLLFPHLLDATGVHRFFPLGLRIPVVTAFCGLPAAFTLSLCTPIAIRLYTSSLAVAGKAAGTVFASSTFGCLLGNYLTGFVLVPWLHLDTIIATVLACLLALSVAARLLRRRQGIDSAQPIAATTEQPSALLSFKAASLLVFLCSFSGMALELSSTRLFAPEVGVSLYLWTGTIGVMLAGTALGNALGGYLADRFANHTGRSVKSLSWCMLGAALMAGSIFPLWTIVLRQDFLANIPFALRIVFCATAVLFAPMLLLGTISPQVIRLCVTDVRHSGEIAGRIYAISTAGAIVGTFATGYLLISRLGVNQTILLAAALPLLASTFLPGSFARGRLLVQTSAPTLLATALMLIFLALMRAVSSSASEKETLETNYFRVQVVDGKRALVKSGMASLSESESRRVRVMKLDKLAHSMVDLDDPQFFFYSHELMQLELLRLQEAQRQQPARVLVIGGGGYTFPRAVRVATPDTPVEVVEIDPGVTEAATRWLALNPAWGIVHHHLDGRQFVSEYAAPGSFDFVTLDAVNDLSVPSHLLTLENHQAVRKALSPQGSYAVTIIDNVKEGKAWKSSYHTLKQLFPYVAVLAPSSDFRGVRWWTNEHLEAPVDGAAAFRDELRLVLVLYASHQPLDLSALEAASQALAQRPSEVYALSPRQLTELLADTPPLVLRDQYAPVDDMMRRVFRER